MTALRTERTSLSGVMELIEAEDSDGTEKKGRAAKRVTVSCARLQLCATHWDVRSSRRVHWYDGRVMEEGEEKKKRGGEDEKSRSEETARSSNSNGRGSRSNRMRVMRVADKDVEGTE